MINGKVPGDCRPKRYITIWISKIAKGTLLSFYAKDEVTYLSSLVKTKINFLKSWSRETKFGHFCLKTPQWGNIGRVKPKFRHFSLG